MTDWKAVLCPSSRLAEREPRAIRQVPSLEAVQASQGLEVVTSTWLLGGKRPRSTGRASQGPNMVTHGAIELSTGYRKCSSAISSAALTEICVKCQLAVCVNMNKVRSAHKAGTLHSLI